MEIHETLLVNWMSFRINHIKSDTLEVSGLDVPTDGYDNLKSKSVALKSMAYLFCSSPGRG